MSASFRKWLSLIALTTSLSVLAVAQDSKVRTSIPAQGEVWVGQRVILVVELLAPGYFASAAAFDLPSPPGLIIVPPRGSPVVSSENVDGVAYSVQRHELSLLSSRAGEQTVPSFTVRFHFKHQPVSYTHLTLPTICSV